ncbi:hypothetical protein SS50377_21007 [Spironucleus salmonicida]|uniref:Uncharacterized protein n=1 Tax=Spironucleus salmonicida TaxID=348837 RepID=V6LSE5_9EUKA|nr:hypothetical protein SS50377_21007 [Spironucleus salmonicida]|eukprot:EST43674.1 Hypothetical protein SS50377_16718 [Spironucleus salmonicida]
MYTNNQLQQDFTLKHIPMAIFSKFIQQLQSTLKSFPVLVPGFGIFNSPNFTLLLLKNHSSNRSGLPSSQTVMVQMPNNVFQVIQQASLKFNIELKFGTVGKLWINRTSHTYGFEYTSQQQRAQSAHIQGTQKLEKQVHLQHKKDEELFNTKYEKQYFSTNYQPQNTPKRALSCTINRQNLQTQSSKMQKICPKFEVTITDTPQKCYVNTLQQLRQCDFEFDQIATSVRNGSLQSLKDQTLSANKQSLMESGKFVATKTECDGCFYARDIKEKAYQKVHSKRSEQCDFNQQHEKDFYWYKQRESSDQNRYREQQMLVRQYNEQVASQKCKSKRFGEKKYVDNVAVLTDKPQLRETMRKRAEQLLKEQLDDCEQKNMKIDQKQEFQEDYINRKHLEESVAREKITDERFKRVQQRVLGNFLNEHLEKSQILPIPKCGQNGSVAQHASQEKVISQFDRNCKIASKANEYQAQLSRTARATSCQQSRVVQREQAKERVRQDLIGKQKNDMVKQQGRQMLQNAYDEDIRLRSALLNQDRKDSWQDMKTYRFNPVHHVTEYGCGCRK